MSGKATISENDAVDIRAMADRFAPKLDDGADQRSEDGDRYGAKMLRDLAFVWSEIGVKAKTMQGGSDKS